MDERLFGLLDDVDLGDVIAAEGRIGATRRGEPSVFVERWAMLTKSVRPLPEKWHGLKDPDLQQRRRELHLATDPDARRPAFARAVLLRTMRRELDARGFIEVETPVLQDVAGGALARPFTTHHEALGVDLKLRISLELYLKRLLGGSTRSGATSATRGSTASTTPSSRCSSSIRPTPTTTTSWRSRATS
jgi:lysyl-tRNA synthetase class 2